MLLPLQAEGGGHINLSCKTTKTVTVWSVLVGSCSLEKKEKEKKIEKIPSWSLLGSCRKHHCGQRCNKKLNCAALNWKWTTWPKRHLNFKRLGACTFCRHRACKRCCPLLINEGNYLGWESAHAAAAPTGIRMLTLPGPPQQLAAQRLKLKLNSLSKTQTTFAWIPGWDMKLKACRLKLCCSIKWL